MISGDLFLTLTDIEAESLLGSCLRCFKMALYLYGDICQLSDVRILHHSNLRVDTMEAAKQEDRGTLVWIKGVTCK